ncbi:glycosyltransferase [Bacteroidia bacterium]|nr:glycosyltransferase [Bacteroidia bacterium]
MSITLTIAICTFNREELLKHCIESLIPQLNDSVELLVIDNGTAKVHNLISQYASVKYVSEANTGLSYARNRAIIEANGNWIMYIDDDAKSDKNLVKIALKQCKANNKVFGGVYYPWYHYGEPKWYKQEYGSNAHNFMTTGNLPNDEFLSGGIMCIHKDIFDQIGPFNTELGMSGNKTGYGEESELQERMINNNIPRVYDSSLIIHHVVAPYKLNANWFLKSNKSRGEDMAKYQTGNKLINIVKQLVVGSIVFSKDLIVFTPKLLGKGYYITNWKIDILRKVHKRIGFISQTIRQIL